MGICGCKIDEKCFDGNKKRRSSKIFESLKSTDSCNTNEKIKDNKEENNIKMNNNGQDSDKSNKTKNESNIPKSSLRKSNNEKPNFSNKKNRSENTIRDKNNNSENNKKISQIENKKYFDNKKKKNNAKTSMNNGENQKLTDSNIDKNDHDDNKQSQNSINISFNVNNPKTFTNTGETPNSEKPDNNIYNDEPNDKEKPLKSINNSIKNESSNKNFDINKDYFLGCPLCLNVPYIESIKYDINNNNDISVTYKCKCELKERTNSMNLSDLIIEKEPKNECQRHVSKDLLYYCEACKMKICIDCYKEQHNNHEVNNNYLMSEKNENYLVKLMDKFKNKFKGYDILVKMHEQYIKNKSINNIGKLDDNSNFINGNDLSKEINNDKVKNEPINLKDSRSNDIQISFHKSIYESGIQGVEQSVINKKFNIKNSSLEPIINQQSNNNNQNSNTSIIDNKNINNLSIEESQNINDFRLFNDSEKSGQINPLNEYYKKPENNSLFSIKEENNEIKNMPIKEENNIINQKQDKLKHYYNSKTLKGHKERVISLIQLESGYLASGSRDGSIIIWDINKGEIISKFKERGQVLCLLEFEPNKLLTGTSENNIGLWDLNSLKDSSSFYFLKHSFWVNCLVKIDKNRFASASNDCNIYIWDYYNRKFLFGLTEHTDCILALIKLNDGRLCSGSADLTIKIWNLEKREIEYELIGHNYMIKNLYQLKNGILLSSDESSLIIWKNFNLDKSINCRSDYRNFCQIDDNCLACAAKDNSIDLLDLNNYQIYDILKGHYSNVICVIKLKDNRLASCSLDKTIKIWEQK